MDKLFFTGFAVYVRVEKPVVDGERYTEPSMTIQGDDVNVAEVVRRLSRGELVPLKDLKFGPDVSDMDPIDIQYQQSLVKDDPPKDDPPKDDPPKDDPPKD